MRLHDTRRGHAPCSWWRRRGGVALTFISLSCADDATRMTTAGDVPEPVDGGGSVYALSTLVWGEDATTGYVTLSDTLDLGDVSLAGAREFPGYMTLGVADGHLLVTLAEDPTIRRFAVSGSLEWGDQGAVSLLNEGVTNAGFSSQYIQRDAMAYAELDVAQRVLWDPVGFEIVGRELDTQLALTRDGLALFANFNRTYFVFDGPVMRPFSYHDQDWFRWADDSFIVVYDPQTHAEKSVIEAPCPGLDSITKDEAGNLYFSNWEYPALHALAGSGAPSCVARVTPEGALDAAWAPDFRSWTGGRHLMNFQYLREGKAIAAVLHDEKFGADFDFRGELSDQTAFWDAYALNYRLWLIDLIAESAEPVRGLPDEDIPPSYTQTQIDGRIFLMREAADFSHTTVYEISLDGEAKEHFTVAGGSAYQWMKVR